MFGYVAPVLSVLNDEQRLRYRSLYCGVCHALKQRHGQSGRLSLSNDMTFLAMLLSSLYEPETVQKDSRCGIHPLKKHSFCSSSMIDYAADMNALLFFWKCEDQRMDDLPFSSATFFAISCSVVGFALSSTESALLSLVSEETSTISPIFFIISSLFRV